MYYDLSDNEYQLYYTLYVLPVNHSTFDVT